MTDAIELLRRDHDEVGRLLAELEASADLADARRQERRRATVNQVIICASKHEAIEEQHFWPVVRRRVQDGVRLADEAVRQELRLKRTLDRLDGLDAADPEFEPLVRQLIMTGRAHDEFEESRVWPVVRHVLSEQELAELGARLEQGRKLASTRPRPGLRPDPEVQELASRIAGATDRIRDVLAGRNGS